ncbi:phospholipase A2 inhibitor and Ly6/PLAUR domain-containing protein-like [Chelmon rostratus]|uniref:phospholipase A2 inhibitor and Ly6/PLAUR domain-containing protein-like n=1 Tax=Chelmon rostratus TaxID=109905 RepID=UPI001BEC6036|nr:phospholipase A2 inhibitor and Ly6/PLAUR domain-containing protein-like [Chelmon rostratus]
MMKQLLSLVWMLCSTADALRCLHEINNTLVLLPCGSDDDMCATAVLQASVHGYHYGPSLVRTCVPSAYCTDREQIVSYTYAVWREAVSIQCCNTDGCNSQNVTYPDLHTENDLMCYTCNDVFSPICNMSVRCVGYQDRCMSGHVTNGVWSFPVRACVSADGCEAMARLTAHHALRANTNVTSETTCCDTSFCNSAGTLKLSVVPLLLGLIGRVVY